MERAVKSAADVVPLGAPAKGESGLFSSESVLNLQKLIFAGSPLSEVLTNIAQLVESQADGMFCTIWLPAEDGKELYCAAAPSLPGFSARVGAMTIGPKGGSCGTAIYRREPVYVTDILTDPTWDLYRDRMLPYGIRSVWSRPLFTSEGKALGTDAGTNCGHKRTSCRPYSGSVRSSEELAIRRSAPRISRTHERGDRATSRFDGGCRQSTGVPR